MLANQDHYAPAQMYCVLCFLSYLQDQLNTEASYLGIVLFSTERHCTNMTVRYAVHLPLGWKYFVFVACLAFDPFSFITFVRYCSVATLRQVVFFFGEE